MAVWEKLVILAVTICLSFVHHGYGELHPNQERTATPDKYLIVLPRVLIGGSSEVICITLHEMREPMIVTLQLTLEDLEEEDEMEYFMEFPYACLDLVVPNIATPTETAILHIAIKSALLDESVAPIIVDSKSVMIEKPKRMTFIETDKPIYKPGQTVKFRILTINENLTPDKSEVDKIWVETPSGVRIAQWLSVKVEQGLISLELPMTPDPMLGTWTIFVMHHEDRTQTNFDIEEYVLPKFEVTIDGPSYLVVNETHIEYNVCGRYTYGQPVMGSVRATLTPRMSYTRHEIDPLIFEAESTGTDGCTTAGFDISDWDLLSNYYSINDAHLNLALEFTETVTGVIISEEDEECELTFNLFILEFVGSKKYKDGLPFNGEISLTTPDGAPAAGIDVHIEIITGGDFSVDVVTDRFGRASFMLPSIGRATVTLEARILSMPTGRQRGQFTVTTPSVSLHLKSQFSPSNTFLQISVPSVTFSPGDEIQLKISHTSSEAITSRDFRPVFISKGNIIRPDYSQSESRSILTDIEYKEFDLTMTATREMAPLTKILVYFIQDGEVVADSLSLRVDQKFVNQVQISFPSPQGKPGDETELLILATSNSLCGVGIVDKSVYLLGGGGNNIQEKQVSQFLKEFDLDGDSGITNERCNGNSEIDDWSWRMPRPSPPSTDAAASFNKAGLLYLTNLNVETAPCPDSRARFGFRDFPMPMFMMRQESGSHIKEMTDDFIQEEAPKREVPRLRSYFPETWLWDLVLVKNDGAAVVNLTVPDTVTEWIGNGFCISETDGIGISSTSSLQAFQPFFVSYTLPYSVIRGETFPVKVTVFNYMTDCLVIELILSESENFTLADSEVHTKQICVCGSQSSSVDFNIASTMIGSMPIEVTAMSVSDGLGVCDNAIVLTSNNAGDAIRQDILVEAEGIEQEVTKSEFFCPSDSSSGFSWTVDIQLPTDLVPDTAWAKVTLSGDVMGSTLSNLQNLLQVPYGCGEQNMLTFVPNVLAMKYMTATNQLTPQIAEEATKNMKLGYQREFNYRHRDGSFSAFGENDEEGSSWLTAYVIRSFYQASQFIEVDTDDLQRSVGWLKGLQKMSGCFLSMGKLCHKDMLGGINNDLTLSAYIIISLLEAGEEATDITIVRGLSCLESQVDSTQDTYALSQIAYALALGNSSKVHDVLETLEDRAIIQDGGKHWVSNRETSSMSSHRSPSSTDVEMTSYILMTYMVIYSHSEVVMYGLPVSKWLVQRRNARGGFGSTQDTVVGLTALSRFAEYTVGGDINIQLNVESSQSQEDWGNRRKLVATNGNRLVLQQLYMENIPTTLNFVGSGDGCALLQVSSFYNTYPEEPEVPEFELLVTVDNRFLTCSEFFVRVCASYTSDDGASNMAVIDFRLQSGYVAARDSLDVLKDNEPTLKRYELDGKSVIFYFDEIRLEPTCVGFTMLQDIKVKDMKPSFVTVYDYYKTDVKKTVTYSLQCLSDISHQPQPNSWGTLSVMRLPEPIIVHICPAKVGTCDAVEEAADCSSEQSAHEDECFDDLNCSGERKCCSDGCSNICVYPLFPVGPSPLPTAPLPECQHDNCPICESEIPNDWFNKFCYSDYAVSIKVKTRNRVKINNHFLSAGGEVMNEFVSYSLSEDCDCELLLNEKYIIFTNTGSFNIDAQELSMTETSLIFPFKGKYRRYFENRQCPVN